MKMHHSRGRVLVLALLAWLVLPACGSSNSGGNPAVADGATGPDGSVVQDAASDRDGSVTPDSGTAPDSSTPTDGATSPDSGTARDSSTPTDAATPPDRSTPPDTPPVPDGAADSGGGVDAPGPDGTTPDPADLDEVTALGFYDWDATDQPRPVRNDLTGSLRGMIQLGQSHTVDPRGNAAREMPSLVALREALLLFTPDPALVGGDGSGIRRVAAKVSVNGQVIGTLEMRHPNLMPPSDYDDARGRPDLVYSRRSWSAVLPWDWVTPGMELELTDDSGRAGVLPAAEIEYGGPAEGMFLFLKLGMLVNPPADGNAAMLSEPARVMTDYFQTAPFARVVAGRYEDVMLRRVIVADGDIYDLDSPDATKHQSKTNGDVYSGDMRENVAKAQFSTGINLANFGIVSAGMNQVNPHLTFHTTVHMAVGLYANGVARHGLSGGNGIATLIDTVGNEFSHEIGHGYGMGHYPGGEANAYFWSGHHADSGWGFDAYLRRMRVSVHWHTDGTGSTINGVKNDRTFKRLYSYNSDAMAGGSAATRQSRYTHYTGYTARRIQQHVQGKAVFDLASTTGYRMWDAAQRRMVDHQFSPVRPKPHKLGVPVMTLIGGYDPDQPVGRSVMYAPVRGNWGNVFQFPPANTGAARVCWVAVTYAAGAVENIEVASTRHVAGMINQFAINLEEARQPSRAVLSCRIDGTEHTLADQAIRTGLPPMAPAVIVGKEHRFHARESLELAELEQELLAKASGRFPGLSVAGQQKVVALERRHGELSPAAREVLDRYLAAMIKVRDLERWMNQRRAAIDAADAATVADLRTYMTQQGLAEMSTQMLPRPVPMKVDTTFCLKMDAAMPDGAPLVVVNAAACVDAPDQRWIMDALGRIHGRARSGLCIATSGAIDQRVGMFVCHPSSAAQRWEAEPNQRLRWTGQTDRYLDYARNAGFPVTWSAGTGTNQQWVGLARSDNPVLALMSAGNLERLYRLFGD